MVLSDAAPETPLKAAQYVSSFAADEASARGFYSRQQAQELSEKQYPKWQPVFHQLHALYQLWGKPTPTLFDPVAVALCFDERWCRVEELRLEVDDKGYTRVARGKPNARVALSVRGEAFLKWFTDRLASGPAAKKGRRD